tara:strand:- start:1051 stop:1824 length:774 start_codon:yes stop_codon:yes gene_type:complete
MAYKTDGSSHRNGIKNEKDQINALNNGGVHKIIQNVKSFKIEKKGGTSHKEDFVIITDKDTYKVSAKRKKKLKTGSYDYVNSSSALSEECSLHEIKQYAQDLKHLDQSTSTTRSNFNKKANSLLKGMDSDEIKKILNEHVALKNKDMNIMVTDKHTGKNYWWNFAESQLYKDILDKNITCKLEFGRGLTSAKISFEDASGKTIDHNLRIRLVLNNGVNALLGKSKNNSTSTPCIKIQQDNCDKVIERLKKENILTIF